MYQPGFHCEVTIIRSEEHSDAEAVTALESDRNKRENNVLPQQSQQLQHCAVLSARLGRLALASTASYSSCVVPSEAVKSRDTPTGWKQVLGLHFT